MDQALRAGAIKVEAEHISATRKNMGYVSCGVAYAILLQHNPDIPVKHNKLLHSTAIREFVYILRKYHDTFNQYYCPDELSLLDCKSILPKSLTGRYFPLFEIYPLDMLFIVSTQTRIMNEKWGWGYNDERPFGCALVWKSLILNWLDYFQDSLEPELLLDEEFSKTPSNTEAHELFRDDCPFYQTYLDAMEEAWGYWRTKERDVLLKSIRDRVGGYKEELVARTWHPDRFLSWCLDLEEKTDLENNWA